MMIWILAILGYIACGVATACWESYLVGRGEYRETSPFATCALWPLAAAVFASCETMEYWKDRGKTAALRRAQIEKDTREAKADIDAIIKEHRL